MQHATALRTLEIQTRSGHCSMRLFPWSLNHDKISNYSKSILALSYVDFSAHIKVNAIPPSPIEHKVANAMTILLQAKGSRPAPAALFLAELVDAKPLAALNPDAVGLYVAAVSVPVAVAVTQP